jgi:protein SCO1/2
MVKSQGVSMGPQAGGRPTFSTGINAARDVTVKQRLENQIPLDAQFTDESGAAVIIGKYFGKKPVWVVMPFYSCKNTCANMLHGLVESLHDPALKWQVGRDFEIVIVSINPKEDATVALAAKKRYMSELGISGAADGWHFLTGSEAEIRKLSDSLGYVYI